jgi:creatinine amidohydrolase/Fe(II)-dependent formamide hydrolase-like protein
VKAVNHPEILRLRFEKDKSPSNTLPLDIRPDIHRLLLAHAESAVSKHGKIWLPIDPLKDMRFSMPYPYEASLQRKHGKISKHKHADRNYVDFSHLTWPEAKKVLKEVDLALLPVGAIEQHGSHLPLDTDAFDAEYLALQVAKRCSHPKPIVLPVLSYGVSYHHDDFSGTISISPDTLAKLVYDIGMNLARQGITKIVIINGHGGNTPALKFAAQLINRDANIFTTVDTGETSDADISSLIETVGDVHSGEIETSTTLAIRPDLVRMKKAKVFIPTFSNRYLDFSSKKSVEWYARTAKISPDGTLGDPTKASAKKGRKIWELMIKNLVDFVEDIKNMSLDEIYQRRY